MLTPLVSTPICPRPIEVRVRLAADARVAQDVELRVAGKTVAARQEGGELVFVVDQVLDHEVIVIGR